MFDSLSSFVKNLFKPKHATEESTASAALVFRSAEVEEEVKGSNGSSSFFVMVKK